MEESRSKCKDCGRKLDKDKHEWFYCPACWEARLSGHTDQVRGHMTVEETATDGGEGLLKLIEALGGMSPTQENSLPFIGLDKYWFESPLVKAAINGRRPRGIKEWFTFFWNIDFFIERWPVGKTLIAIIILLALLF